MDTSTQRTTAEKIQLFKRFFTGLTHVYGSYDPATGRSFQVKAPVTDQVIYNHLKGLKPYGVYLLVQDRTRAIVADFDQDDANPPLEFIAAAKQYKIPAYLERSKRKGWHAYVFFDETGVPAVKARCVIRHILDEIKQPQVEVFPKQDALDTRVSFGNYINAALFGSLVPQGRTVFVDERGTLEPYPKQWDFLASVQTVPESLLDEIIDLNNLTVPVVSLPTQSPAPDAGGTQSTYGLPPCHRRLLREGTNSYQRVSCFRLTVGLKKAGLPYDITLSALKTWVSKNHPTDGKGLLTETELQAQTASAFNKSYAGYGCEDAAIKPYCNPECPIQRKKESMNGDLR
jgi:hypothetical protein